MTQQKFGIDSGYAAVQSRCAQKGGVIQVSMGQLRDHAGLGRLTPPGCKKIEGYLAKSNLGTLPASLPTSQGSRVLVYSKSSPAGKAIASILWRSGEERLRARISKPGDSIKRILRLGQVLRGA